AYAELVVLHRGGARYFTQPVGGGQVERQVVAGRDAGEGKLLVEQLRVLLGIGQLHAVGGGLHPAKAVVAHASRARGTTLGGHEHHARADWVLGGLAHQLRALHRGDGAGYFAPVLGAVAHHHYLIEALGSGRAKLHIDRGAA
nr:hypothetical protein [Tanacetum cinerariifolium]